MSKRVGQKYFLALLLLFAGAQVTAQSVTPRSLIDSSVVVTGLVSSYEADLGLVTIGDVTVFVGDLAADLGISIFPGDELLLIGTNVVASGLVWAATLEFVDRSAAQSITGTGKKSITGTGKQSITGTGRKSITGTGLQSITGTGTQSITGTGASLQSITGTGISAQSITGTGKSSITGTGRR